MKIQNSTKKLLYRIFQNYIRKHNKKLFISFFCMIIVSATTAINAWMMQPVLDDIFIKKDERLILIIPLVNNLILMYIRHSTFSFLNLKNLETFEEFFLNKDY